MDRYDEAYIVNKIGVSKPVLLIDEAMWGGNIENPLVTKCLLEKDLFFWKHHFISKPVMPGTYMLEMLAQSAAFFEMLISKTKTVPIIVSMNKVRFLREVTPGQLLKTEVSIKKIEGQYYSTQGKMFCEGKTVCKAEMVHYVNI